MNVPFHRTVGGSPRSAPAPRPALGTCLALSVLALAAGCAVAPAGATGNSPAVGPVGPPAGVKSFAPFPVPTRWTGLDAVDYTMVLKAKTGTTKRIFGFTVSPSMVFWLNCAGPGTAHLISPSIGLSWGIRCGNITGNTPGGLTVRPPHATLGKTVKVQVTAAPGARWEIRIDAARRT